MKKKKQAPRKESVRVTLALLVMGWLMAGCSALLAYEWVGDLTRGVHHVYARGGPTRTYTLVDSAAAYWASMAWDFMVILLVAGISWVSFWGARAGRH
ncbi:hypothetical protein [Pseudomonas asplenii]|uniref:hypothetical protein n=1 Tax=Pseudomonas asplenii TaxID=53407 RepID=UPI0012F727CC|nr:hypothetical protein [Pseudomonas fuscovaginae]